MNPVAWRTVLIVMSCAILFNIVYNYLSPKAGQVAEISYSRFRSELDGNNLKNVRFKGVSASGEFLKKVRVVETVQGQEVARDAGAFTTTMPALADPALLAELTAHKVDAEEKGFSEEMAWMIDQEITAIIRQGEKVADELLSTNRPGLDALAVALQEEETLDGARVEDILRLVKTDEAKV